MVLMVAVEVVGSWNSGGWRWSGSGVVMGWMKVVMGVVVAVEGHSRGSSVEDRRNR